MWWQEKRELVIKLDAQVNAKISFEPKPPAASQILIYGGSMGLSITAGGAALMVQLIPLPSGSVFDNPANLALTCDNSAVVVAPVAGDASGTMFNVSAPAGTPAASANLNATGLAGGVQISGTAVLLIVAASAPPATSIGIVAATAPPASGGASSPPAAAAHGQAPASK